MNVIDFEGIMHAAKHLPSRREDAATGAFESMPGFTACGMGFGWGTPETGRFVILETRMYAGAPLSQVAHYAMKVGAAWLKVTCLTCLGTT